MCSGLEQMDRICGFLLLNDFGVFIYCCKKCAQEFTSGTELERHILVEQHDQEQKDIEKVFLTEEFESVPEEFQLVPPPTPPPPPSSQPPPLQSEIEPSAPIEEVQPKLEKWKNRDVSKTGRRGAERASNSTFVIKSTGANEIDGKPEKFQKI